MENENQVTNEEENVEYSKFEQFMLGQFRRTSKKKIALFIGRAVQELTASLQPFIEQYQLRMDTLRFAVHEEPLTDGDGREIENYDLIIVACEVGSYHVMTEEDKRQIEERRKAREQKMLEESEEIGEAAMKAFERQIYTTPPEDRIQ